MQYTQWLTEREATLWHRRKGPLQGHTNQLWGTVVKPDE